MARKTYEIGRRRRRNWRLAIAAVVALILLAGGLYVYKQFQKDTAPQIKNSAGTTHAQEIPNSKVQHFDEGVFVFDLPSDWKLIKHDSVPYDLYSFRSTVVNADNRYLDVYADKIPLTLAVNKAVAVKPQGTNLSHGMISDNCTTFTSGTSPDAHTAKPLSFTAKWDGVEFLCDNDNVQRNVAGTSAIGSVNKVTLTSPGSGAHSYFFVYTDNNYNPDYSIFYNMLDSFMLK